MFVQKVEHNSSSEEKTKIIKDKQKIRQVLTMVEGLKVKETNKALGKMKSQNTYMFAFSKGKNLEAGKKVPYAFNVLSDGTFIFLFKDFDSLEKPRITLEKHKKLLEDIKKLCKINF